MAAGNKILTPLWVFSLFLTFTQTIALHTVSRTNGSIQVALTVFVIAFPTLVAVFFFTLLWKKPHHIYAPIEYGKNVGAKEYIEAITSHNSSADTSSHILRIFWKPDGDQISSTNEARLLTWLRSNGMERHSITVFLRGAEFKDLRRRALQELGLSD